MSGSVNNPPGETASELYRRGTRGGANDARAVAKMAAGCIAVTWQLLSWLRRGYVTGVVALLASGVVGVCFAAVEVSGEGFCQAPSYPFTAPASAGRSILTAKVTDSAGVVVPYTTVRFSVVVVPESGLTQANLRYLESVTGPDGTAASVVDLEGLSIDAKINVTAAVPASGQVGSIPLIFGSWLPSCSDLVFQFPATTVTEGNPYITFGYYLYRFNGYDDYRNFLTAFRIHSVDPRIATGSIHAAYARVSEPDALPMDIEGHAPGTVDLILPSADTTTVTVIPREGEAPLVHSRPITAAYLGVPYRYRVEATSPVNTPLTYSLTSALSGMSLDPQTGLIEWIPVFDGIDDHVVKLAVSDGVLSTYQHFHVTLCAGLGDADRDGVCDPVDNCPYAANPDQADGNGNGTGDRCDLGLRYSLTRFGFLPGDDRSVATALNNLGQVVGHSWDSSYARFRPFVWGSTSGLSALECPAGVPFCYATGINDLGTTVGWFTYWRTIFYGGPNIYDGGIIWRYPGTATDPPFLIRSYPLAAINNRQQVAGTTDNWGPYYFGGQANVEDLSTGAVTTFPSPDDPTYAEAGSFALNNSGFVAIMAYTKSPIVGGGMQPALLWDSASGTTTPLGFLGRSYSWVHGINDRNETVGETSSAAGYEAFIWDSAHGMRGLGELPGGGFFSLANAIGNSGLVVGESVSARGREAFISDGVRPLVPLRILLDNSGAGWRLQTAAAINDSDQIVGSGINPEGLREGFLLTPLRVPVASDANITAVSGQLVSWQPIVSDPNGDALTCRLGTLPANGTATIAFNCASGTYQSTLGFIGTDSFTYLANDGQYDSNPATVTVAVTEPPPTDPCLAQYPVSQFSQTGKEGTLTIIFTGNITSHTNKAVKLCPGTTLKYQTTSTQGPVVCKVKNNTTRGSGSLKINDHIKCTDKPAGKDKIQFKVKSGVFK